MCGPGCCAVLHFPSGTISRVLFRLSHHATPTTAMKEILVSMQCQFPDAFAPFDWLQIEDDLLHPNAANEKRKHKMKRLVASPNSFFMDVKCPGCFNITTVFSHAQTVVVCGNCNTVLCQPTGGKARLTEGCSFRRKVE
jgi:small subunit ribosomal protein S27e